MRPCFLILIGLVGLSAPQTEPQLVLSPTLLERLYSGYVPETGLVQDSEQLEQVRGISMRPVGDDQDTLILVSRTPVNENLQPIGGMATARSLDAVVVDRFGDPILTLMSLFQFGGHSRVTIEERSYPDLDGSTLIGVLDHHTNQGVEGETLHLVAIGSAIREVLAVRMLLSDCWALGVPDRSVLRTERAEIVFSSAEPYRLEVVDTLENCDEEILERRSNLFSWSATEERYVPDRAEGN